jgi:hypothetical protein
MAKRRSGARSADFVVVACLLRTVMSLVAFGVTTHGASATQDLPEDLIFRRAVAASQEAQPEWRFTRTIVKASPLMDEQLGVAAGSWIKASDEWVRDRLKSTDEPMWVYVRVYTIATEEAADRWLFRNVPGGVGRGRNVEPYEIGDRATMATYAGPKGITQYETWFRKGRFLVTLKSRSKENIETFAKIVIAAISDAAAEREKH